MKSAADSLQLLIERGQGGRLERGGCCRNAPVSVLPDPDHQQPVGVCIQDALDGLVVVETQRVSEPEDWRLAASVPVLHQGYESCRRTHSTGAYQQSHGGVTPCRPHRRPQQMWLI